jgi:serine/threonine protein kinase
VLAGLAHTNVVRLLDYVDRPPVPYLVLEHADGTPLVRPLHPDVAANIASQIAAGLDAVHDRKVLHLGVCPAAIGVTPDGIPRLGGFGSARPLGSSLEDLVPRGGGLGKANYTAPEVLARRADAVGFTADVFGLGATLYELLSGRPPFNAPGLAAVREWVLTRPPEPLPAAVPDPLAELCVDCLARDPARRPQRALDVTARLGMMALSEDSTVSLEAGPRITRGTSFRIQVERGPTDVGRTARFQQRRVTVGREDGRDLQLRSDKVSKHHFTVHWDDEAEAYLLTDNASKNGVLVNDRRVIGSRRLAPGDRIRVAEYELAFQPD